MKRIKLIVLAAVMVIMFAVPVMAQKMDFSFSVEDAEDTSPVAYSDNARKDNNSSQAFIECKKSNITENDDFGFWIVGQKGDNSAWTNYIRATANTGTYRPIYNRTYYQGNMYRLKGETFLYYVKVEGEFEP